MAIINSKSCLGCFLAGGFLFLVGITIPNFLPAGKGGQLTACKSNLRNFSLALDMYASDNGGRYPVSLNQLTKGNYLKVIPTCPAAGTITYNNYTVTTTPDAYSISCCGNFHAEPMTGFPGDTNNCRLIAADRA